MSTVLLVIICNVVGGGIYHGLTCAGKLDKEGWQYSKSSMLRTVLACVIQVVLCVIFPWSGALSWFPVYQFVWLSVLLGYGAAGVLDNCLKLVGWKSR